MRVFSLFSGLDVIASDTDEYGATTGRDRRVTTQVTTQNFPGESPIVYGVAYPPPARGRAWWRSENILEKSRGMGFSHGTFVPPGLG